MGYMRHNPVDGSSRECYSFAVSRIHDAICIHSRPRKLRTKSNSRGRKKWLHFWLLVLAKRVDVFASLESTAVANWASSSSTIQPLFQGLFPDLVDALLLSFQRACFIETPYASLKFIITSDSTRKTPPDQSRRASRNQH